MILKMESSKNMCRICLSINASKNLDELPKSLDVDQTYCDIMLFCLGINVTNESKHSTKACGKCFKKIISYSKFKTLALKSDSQLRSLQESVIYLNECDVKKEENLDTFDGHDYCEDIPIVKNDLEVKNELPLSDDEVLSVIKNIKYEYSGISNENEKAKKIKEDKKSNKAKLEKVVCVECGKAVKNIQAHMGLHNPDLKKYWPCKLCSKKFSSLSGRAKHIRIKHQGFKKKCDICDKEFVALVAHQLIVHNTHKLPYACMICNKRFLYQGMLNNHMTLHTEERKFECDTCHKKYTTKLNLLTHIRQVHYKEKPHLCQYCSKSFFKKDHLQIHIRVHTKEKPYKCHECGKHYSNSTVLRKHMILHTGIKSYKCQLCDQAFAHASYLEKHARVHSKVKNYPCKYCGLMFGRSDHKKKHEQTTHEKYPTVDKEILNTHDE